MRDPGRQMPQRRKLLGLSEAVLQDLLLPKLAHHLVDARRQLADLVATLLGKDGAEISCRYLLREVDYLIDGRVYRHDKNNVSPIPNPKMPPVTSSRVTRLDRKSRS